MTLPLTLPVPTFTNGEMAQSVIISAEELINTTWAEGKTAKDTASARATAVKDQIDALLATPGTLHVSTGTVPNITITAPGVNIPESVTVADVYDEFSTQYLELATWLDGKFTAFRATYFPNESALYSAAEASLTAALANDSYLPPSVQAQIWGDDQARILEDKVRAQDAVVASFAARRFPLTPDVAAAATLQIEQKAQNELAESSRKIAIMSVEQYRFVITKALEARNAALAAANEYVKALASAPEMTSRLVNVGYDAQSKLISAAAAFYNADANAKETISKVAQYNNSIALDAAVKNQAADMSLVDNKIKALLSELQTLSQMATSLFNNLHASVSLSGSSSQQSALAYSSP